MKSDFTKGVERLVNPVDVGTIHFIQSFNKYIPKKLQRKMVEASGKKTPHMGFVVEPYSHFLCYEIEDHDWARRLLPNGFKLIKTSIFDDDQPKYYGIFGCFNAHTSGFWGLRVEFYIIAENTKTNMISWVIVDYDTNTVTYDPKNGLMDPNAVGSLFTIDYNGIVILDAENEVGRKIAFTSDSKTGLMQGLNQRLWVEGNLSIAYGGDKSDEDPGLFSLTFNPKEFKQALRIPRTALEIVENTWFKGLLKDKPSEIACFPYAQHFISDSPGHASEIENEAALKASFESIDFNMIDVFSTSGFRKRFIIGGVVSFFVNMTLLLLVIFK